MAIKQISRSDRKRRGRAARLLRALDWGCLVRQHLARSLRPTAPPPDPAVADTRPPQLDVALRIRAKPGITRSRVYCVGDGNGASLPDRTQSGPITGGLAHSDRPCARDRDEEQKHVEFLRAALTRFDGPYIGSRRSILFRTYALLRSRDRAGLGSGCTFQE